MAISKRRSPKNPIPINNSTAVEDQPEPGTEIPEPSTPPAAPPDPKAIPHAPTFQQRCTSIPKQDWGPRANIYLYRVEPQIDRTRSSDAKYIMKYDEPLTEDRILADHGSGRYKAVLNYRKAGQDHGDLIDQHYYDILNMKFPPKIPIGEWTDDPRNKRWAWAKETAAAPPAANGAPPVETFVQMLRATNDIRRDIRDEMEAMQPPAAPVQPAAPQPLDTFAIAEKILQMRSDNPMVTILMEQMKTMHESAERARQREYDLQKELRQLSMQHLQQPAAVPVKDPLESLIDGAERFKKLKEVLGGGADEAAAPIAGRSKMSGWQEILLNVTQSLINSPLASAIAQKMLEPNGAPPVANPQQVQVPGAQPAQQASQEQTLRRIAGQHTETMLRMFGQGAAGADFAAWMYDGHPAQFAEVSAAGGDRVLELYKASPLWPQLRLREAEFVKFIQDVCAWTPDQAPEEGDGDDGVILDEDDREGKRDT